MKEKSQVVKEKQNHFMQLQVSTLTLHLYALKELFSGYYFAVTWEKLS